MSWSTKKIVSSNHSNDEAYYTMCGTKSEMESWLKEIEKVNPWIPPTGYKNGELAIVAATKSHPLQSQGRALREVADGVHPVIYSAVRIFTPNIKSVKEHWKKK